MEFFQLNQFRFICTANGCQSKLCTAVFILQNYVFISWNLKTPANLKIKMCESFFKMCQTYKVFCQIGFRMRNNHSTLTDWWYYWW